MLSRRTILAAGVGLSAAGFAGRGAAQETFSSQALRRGRAVVPVQVNDHVGLNFVVDTAANNSVIAADLVDALQLPFAGDVGMHTLVGREVVPTCLADRLKSGALDARGLRLAVGQRAAMAGLDGLLGTDLLSQHKLLLNFRDGRGARIVRSVAPARGMPDRLASDTPYTVLAERRFGNLMMIPARIGLSSAVAIIDSGAEGTALNWAAARAGKAIPITPADGMAERRIQSPTGQATTGVAMVLPTMDFAGATATNLAVAVGDFHTFDLWGLRDQPAVLLGLDVLGLFSAVHLDLKRGEFSVRF